jgi:energy-coupling factor transporter ATP-binding protein EcfA2
MYVSRVTLTNIRAFTKLEVRLWSQEERPSGGNGRPDCGIILGRNGTGKSTLLRCLAIGLSNERDAGALLARSPGRLLARGAKEGRIEVELSAIAPAEGAPHETMSVSTEVVEKDEADTIGDRSDPAQAAKRVFLCGYGAGRTLQALSDVGGDYRPLDSLATLFDYDRPLISVELTLRRLRDFLGEDPYDRTMRGLKAALGLGPKDRIELARGGGVVISGPEIGEAMPLEGWADGYRLTLGWVLDLYAWAIRAGTITAAGGIRGIALVDELEQHLHPSFQLDLLGRLRRLLPELQIIGTTHSPLIAMGALPHELIALKRRGKRVVCEEHLVNLGGYSAEDMLVDPRLFDAPAYRPETAAKLARYHRLATVKQDERTAKQNEELTSLATELASQQLPEARQSGAVQELQRLLEKHAL